MGELFEWARAAGWVRWSGLSRPGRNRRTRRMNVRRIRLLEIEKSLFHGRSGRLELARSRSVSRVRGGSSPPLSKTCCHCPFSGTTGFLAGKESVPSRANSLLLTVPFKVRFSAGPLRNWAGLSRLAG